MGCLPPSTNAVCPACCRWTWPGEGGSLLPPQGIVWGSWGGARQGSPKNGDGEKSVYTGDNAYSTHAVLVCNPPLWRTGQLLATCLPRLALPSLSSVHCRPSSTTRDSLRFRLFRAGWESCSSASSASISLPASPSLRLELGFSKTFRTQTISCVPGNFAPDCSHCEPLEDTLSRSTNDSPPRIPRPAGNVAPRFYRQRQCLRLRGLAHGSSRTRFSQHLQYARCCVCCWLRSRIEALWWRE